VVVFKKSEYFSPRVKELTDGRGADVVINGVGTALFAPTRKSVALGGQWVMVGELSGEFVPFNLAQLFLRHVTLLSGNGSVKRQLDDAFRMILSRCLFEASAFLSLGALQKFHEDLRYCGFDAQPFGLIPLRQQVVVGPLFHHAVLKLCLGNKPRDFRDVAGIWMTSFPVIRQTGTDMERRSSSIARIIGRLAASMNLVRQVSMMPRKRRGRPPDQEQEIAFMA